MWLSFASTVLFFSLMLYIPGALACRAFDARWSWSIALAPLTSTSLIAGGTQALYMLGQFTSPLFLLSSLIGITSIAAISARHASRLAFPRLDFICIALTVALGAALGYNLMLSRLGDLDSIFQAYDVTQHLSLIRSMADSGNLTSLEVSPYLTTVDAVIAPVDYSGFYPAAWHSLCALAVMLLGISAPLAINASMFVFCCIVFPISMLAFLSEAFDGNKGRMACCVPVILAFAAFPWNLAAFGPVYPNVAGFCLMPAEMALFIHLFRPGIQKFDRARTAAMLLLGLVGLTLCHPNTVFTCIVLLSPYCIFRIHTTCALKGFTLIKTVACCAGFIFFCLAAWIFCYHLPVLHDTVSHYWPPFANLFQEIVNILLLSYVTGFYYEIAAQLLLAALVIFGYIKCIHEPSTRWLAASYTIAGFILLICASQDGDFRQIVAGFWYTDPMRISAMCAIGAVPLAAVGAQWLYELVLAIVKHYNSTKSRRISKVKIATILMCAFLVINYMPNFNISGQHHQFTEDEAKEINEKQLAAKDWPKATHTTFGDYRSTVSSIYECQAPLDNAERDFLNKVKETVPDSSLIINDPMDGSFLGYGANGLRMYYRNFTGFGGTNESADSKLIRLGLNSYAANTNVRQAVNNIDAQYVLILHGSKEQAGFIDLRCDWNQNLFSGITQITSETPGFTCLLESDSMALYKIDR